MVEAWHHVANAEGRLRRSWCGALALGGGGPAAGSLTRTITYDQGEAHAGQGKKLTVRCACGLHRNVKFLTEESKRVWPRRAYQLLFFVGPQGPECRGGMSEAGIKKSKGMGIVYAGCGMCWQGVAAGISSLPLGAAQPSLFRRCRGDERGDWRPQPSARRIATCLHAYVASGKVKPAADGDDGGRENG